MTSAISVAKTIIANLPTALDARQAPSQATLGLVPLPPPRQYRRTPHSPILLLPGVFGRVRALGSVLDDDDDDDNDGGGGGGGVLYDGRRFKLSARQLRRRYQRAPPFSLWIVDSGGTRELNQAD